MLKKRVVSGGNVVLTKPLPMTSTLMPKTAALREFITATAYDDGSPRIPGYFTVRNKTTTFEVTVYDVDAGLRLVVRGETLDSALGLTDQLLGVEDAAWELDSYLQEQLLRRSKKKR